MIKNTFPDITNSFVYFSDKFGANWRSKINTILSDGNKTIYLTESCISEVMGKVPFLKEDNYEYSICVESHNSQNECIAFRQYSTSNIFDKFSRKKAYEVRKDISATIKSERASFTKLDNDYLFNNLISLSSEKFFLSIKFQLYNKTYNIFTELKYINYGKFASDNFVYLQPIAGKVPLILDDKLHLAYLVKYICKHNNGNLQFAIINNSKIVIEKRVSLIGKLLRSIFNILSYFVTQFAYSRIVNIENSDITFYKLTKL